MTEFLIAAAFAASTLLLVYPFLLYPLILALLPPAPDLKRGGACRERVTLLLCARNEARDLPTTLRGLRALHRRWPELRIRAWNDGSTDLTGVLLDAERGHIRVHHAPEPVGKAAALRRMVDDTGEGIILMMDANVRVRPDAVMRFRDHFSDPTVGAVAARLIPDGGGESIIGRSYWALEEWIKRLETRSGTTMGCDGALWGIRRSLYPAFGLAESDDFRPSMEAVLAGYRVISAPDIIARERAVPDRHAARRAARIACGAWHAHRRIWPRLRHASPLVRFQYVSHKLVRWFSGLWLLIAAGSGLGLALTGGWGDVVLPALAAAAAGAFAGVPPFAGLRRICAGFLGTTLGVLLAMRGRSIGLWTPVREA